MSYYAARPDVLRVEADTAVFLLEQSALILIQIYLGHKSNALLPIAAGHISTCRRFLDKGALCDPYQPIVRSDL